MTQLSKPASSGIFPYVKNIHHSFPEKFSVTSDLMRWMDLIPVVDQISSGARLLMAATEVFDGIGLGAKYFIEKIAGKSSDKMDVKRAYYQVAMSIARLVRADIVLGFYPSGSLTLFGLNKILLLAWNLFGSLENPLVDMKEGEGWTFGSYAPFSFRKGPIFQLGVFFPAYMKNLDAAKEKLEKSLKRGKKHVREVVSNLPLVGEKNDSKAVRKMFEKDLPKDLLEGNPPFNEGSEVGSEDDVSERGDPE